MTATDILHTLEQAGCTVILDGNTIKVRGGQLNDDLRAAIRAHKPELITMLREKSDLDAQAQEISKIFHEKGWVTFSSQLLNGEEVVFVKDEKVVIPTRWKDAVTYTLAELEALTAPPILDAEDLRMMHEAKRVFEGEIVTVEEAIQGDKSFVL